MDLEAGPPVDLQLEDLDQLLQLPQHQHANWKPEMFEASGDQMTFVKTAGLKPGIVFLADQQKYVLLESFDPEEDIWVRCNVLHLKEDENSKVLLCCFEFAERSTPNSYQLFKGVLHVAYKDHRIKTGKAVQKIRIWL